MPHSGRASGRASGPAGGLAAAVASALAHALAALLILVVTAGAGPPAPLTAPGQGPGQGPGQQGLHHILAQFPDNNATAPRLTHMVLDRATGRIVVGAVNRLFQLDANLRTLGVVVTGPKADSPLCHASGCESPDIPTALTDNVNKILVLDPESRFLIVCGSLSQGSCEKYSVNNITHKPEFFARAIAANDEHSSTYAFIGPERYNNWGGSSNVLYVGTTFTNNGEYRHDVPAISSRRLHNLDFAELSFSKQSSLQIEVKYRDHFLVNYVYGFNASDYAYFVVVQKQSHLPEQEELGFVTRLARTCITDANYDSYTEVTLQCQARGTEDGQPKLLNYNLIQDAKVVPAGQHLANSMGLEAGDPVMIGVFSPSRSISAEPQARSAVCVYSLKDIEAKFNENIHMCFNGSLGYRNMNYISGLILDGMCPTAGVSTAVRTLCLQAAPPPPPGPAPQSGAPTAPV
ncbi:hypothetical protein ONE63_005655 [Megalurothrips usitatus]|uniref:Sema domain-containing protein n=1 Tax=Megalurothrips usitatus TaxID=439358 RepID=A0AAV7XZE4_9NEOP|nr:hypothetical protein ONE63_005655 [Megalurothrips usitatus]